MCKFKIEALLSFLIFSYCLSTILAAKNEICHSGPTSLVNCVDVGNRWETWKTLIDEARDGDEIIFCPFRIKIAGDPGKPSQKAAFVCQKKGSCIIYGEGQAIVINHQHAETIFWGFQFEHTTKTAVHVRDDSKKLQMICSCTFRSNRHDRQRGGAIRSDRDTNILVFQSIFFKNIAGRGGSIYGRGHVNVTSSVFEENQAEQGGAIGFASYANLVVQGNVFSGNSAYSGPNIYSEIDESDLTVQYSDGGGNMALSTSCNGLYNRVPSSRKCHEFELRTASPSHRASFVPSSFPTIPPSGDPTTMIPSIPSLLPNAWQVPSLLSPAEASSQPTDFVSSDSPSNAVLYSTPSAHAIRSPVLGEKSSSETFSQSWQPSTRSTLPQMYTPPLDPAEEDLPLVDRNQSKGYYNFNVNDFDFGPNVWSNIDISNNEYSRYARVGLKVSENQCGATGQTPIDLTHVNRECKEFHQIRARGGKWKNLTKAGEITFHILPSHLRIQIDSDHPKAPRADSPGGFVELYADHVEITKPSLHTVNGVRYDAEYSIYHVQGSLSRILVMSVVMDASQNIHNRQFQKVLNAFWRVDTCGISSVPSEHASPPDENDGNGDSSSNRGQNPDKTPKANIPSKFNLYNTEMVPSIYWYAYDGSLPRVSTVCTAIALL